MPIEKEITDENKLFRIAHVSNVLISRTHGLGRELIILEGDDPMGIAGIFKKIVAGLKKDFNTDNEPMMNIIGSHDKETWRLIVFPRLKHRPDAFFEEGDARVAVSPAVIEMGGTMVTPLEKDFKRLDASTVESIFEEVSLKSETIKKIIDIVADSLCNSNSQSPTSL
jgi:hypothetical protein